MEKLTPIEAARMRDVLSAFLGDYDNLFYQYQNGYLDDEYYRYMIEPSIRVLAPWWKKYETPGGPVSKKKLSGFFPATDAPRPFVPLLSDAAQKVSQQSTVRS